MKDLITCMGSLMILMVFVMQFASNQVMITKFAASDYIVEEYQKNIHENTESQDDLKKRLSSIFQCDEEEIYINKEGKYCDVSVPVRGIIACGSLLGIPEDENIAVYRHKFEVLE